MTLITQLRRGENALHQLLAPAHRALCTPALMHEAFVSALHDGLIKNASLRPAWQAALPIGGSVIAPMTAGTRQVGYRSAAFAGAGVAARLVREIAPPGVAICGVLTGLGLHFPLAALAPLAGFGALEMAGSEDHNCRFSHRHFFNSGAPTVAYRTSFILRQWLLRAADASPHTATIFMAGAIVHATCQLTSETMGLLGVAAAAIVGALTGVLIESAQHIRFLMTQGDTVPLWTAAADEEARNHAAQNRFLLGLIGRGPMRLQERLNEGHGPIEARELAILAWLTAHENAREPHIAPVNRIDRVLGPVARPVEPGAPPLAVDSDVHGLGRDAATKRALAVLLRGQPDIHVGENLAALRAYLHRINLELPGVATRAHPAGCQLVRAAWTALDGPVPLDGNLPFTNVRNVLDFSLEGLGSVPLARVVAGVWRAIDGLPHGAEPAPSIRDERRSALVTAMATCINEQGSLVCSAGQAQQLALVLQGFVAGVQLERFDAPAPVAQFIMTLALQMDNQVNESGPLQPEAVRRRLDEAYVAGCAIYVGTERVDLVEQLRSLGYMQHDLSGWVPPHMQPG